MTHELSLPLDAAGFLRRRCAKCKRDFKVRWKRADGEMLLRSLCALLAHVNAQELAPDPPRFCPYCGGAAGADGFSTGAQRAFLEERAGYLRGEVRYFQ